MTYFHVVIVYWYGTKESRNLKLKLVLCEDYETKKSHLHVKRAMLPAHVIPAQHTDTQTHTHTQTYTYIQTFSHI